MNTIPLSESWDAMDAIDVIATKGIFRFAGGAETTAERSEPL